MPSVALPDLLPPALMDELTAAAWRFRRDAAWTLPRIFTGHPVAHRPEDDVRVKNFSTITRVVQLSDGQLMFLVYRYPLSWIHSLTDNLQRWGSGRPSAKPFRRSVWHRRFSKKSQLLVYPINVPGVVAMQYCPNFNLYDVLHHNVGNLPARQIQRALGTTSSLINVVHAQGITWGELIVQNIILRRFPPVEIPTSGPLHREFSGRAPDPTLLPILCDTEVEYQRGVPLSLLRMYDWRDFIFSACGANTVIAGGPEALVPHLLQNLNDDQVRELLIKECRKPRSLGQTLFWQGFSGALSLPSVEMFDRIRSAIVNAA